jgi:hypothetical protein
MTPTVSYRFDVPTIRQDSPLRTRTKRKHRVMPRGAAFAMALPLSVCLWVGVLVWWLR